MKAENSDFQKLDRRTFLKYAGMAGATALLGSQCIDRDIGSAIAAKFGEVSDATLNLYRSEFIYTRGDSQGYSPHCVNCKGNCAWRTFERDGRIVREEQVAGYPQIAPSIPDANPRGCNKGALHSQSLYEKDRILYPIKRIGPRGRGKWERISWDEALQETAEKIVDVVGEGEFDKLMVYAGTGILAPVRRAASLRLGSLLGAVRFNVASAVGDMFPGATITFGISTVGCSSEAWYEADYLFVWGINPSVSRIPDAHYVWEGKYRGCRVVTISPEYSPTARQSSLWIPLKPGADAYFAMSMVNVIIKERLYDEEFIREQTDLPFLVKLEDGKLLRQSDVMKGGSTEIFYFFDEESSRPVEAPGSRGNPLLPTLRLDGVRPVLEGFFKVKDTEGKEIEVTPVFELIKKEAEKFPPEETQKYTGIHPSIIYDEARAFARAKTAIIMQGYRLHKYFWGILACRGAALMLALTGHYGRRGGLDIDNEWSLGDVGALSSPKPPRFGSGFIGEWMQGEMWRSFESHYDDAELKRKVGLGKKELLELIENAVKKEGFAYFDKPKVMLLFHDNKFARNNAQKQTEKAVLDSVEFYANVNYRMDSSAALADIVLPTITNYEGWDYRFDPGFSRFANMMIPPEGLMVPGEAKSEWEICMLLTKKIQEIAKKRGIGAVEDPTFNVTRNLDTIHEDYATVDGKRMENEKGLLEWALSKNPALGGKTIDEVKEIGFIVPNDAAGQTSPLYPDKPFYPLEPQVYLKIPHMTLSGRLQFYVDPDLYLKLGCATPTAREPVRPSKYPYAYFNPHTRYGIHTTWRTGKHHLRLQRGVPYVCINPKTANSKGIGDGDRIRVFNDVGEFYAMAKLHPGTPLDAVWTEHAWENFQFKENKGYNNVIAGIITPLELAGNYGQMSFSPFWDGNQLMSEASVNVEKA